MHKNTANNVQLIHKTVAKIISKKICNRSEFFNSTAIFISESKALYRMRTVRVYDNQPLQTDTEVTLCSDAFNHAIKVLRMNVNDPLTLFNGNGCDYQAVITSIQKKSADVRIIGRTEKNNESPIRIHLGQVLSRGDKMDFTVQKSVELGINVITPLVSERCGVRLNDERSQKKQETLQKIVISACEQSGRAVIPEVRPLMSIEEFLSENTDADELKVTMNPYADCRFRELPQAGSYRLLVGPEGGFTDEEVELSRKAGYRDVLVGPRILRTETAALVALSIIQSCFGDI